MPALKLDVNGAVREVDVDGQTPLLWVLRDHLGLTGTKYGCGRSLCGACTVHVDGRAVRSCVRPVETVVGARVVTIEGLASDGASPLQRAWIERGVPQCGYCQAGQIMQAADLLARVPDPTDAQVDAALSGNLCRCGTYGRIRDAVRLAARRAREATEGAR